MLRPDHFKSKIKPTLLLLSLWMKSEAHPRLRVRLPGTSRGGRNERLQAKKMPHPSQWLCGLPQEAKIDSHISSRGPLFFFFDWAYQQEVQESSRWQVFTSTGCLWSGHIRRKCYWIDSASHKVEGFWGAHHWIHFKVGSLSQEGLKS